VGGFEQTLFVQISELQQSAVTAHACVAARQVCPPTQTLFVQISVSQQSAVTAHASVASRHVGPLPPPPPPPHPARITAATNTLRFPIVRPPVGVPSSAAHPCRV